MQRFKGDVLAVTALQGGCNEVLAGLRNGSIHLLDKRSVALGNPLLDAHEGASVADLLALADGRHFVASRLNQTIELYDLRRCSRPLQVYHGHQCETVSYPLHMDSTEAFLFSCGQDHAARCWRLSTGELLTTLAVDAGCEVVKCGWSWDEITSPGLLVGGGTSEVSAHFYDMNFEQ